MHDLNPAQLTTVVGGARKNDQITQQITALQTSIKDTLSATSKDSGGNNTFMMLAMMMAMRPQQSTVIAAGGPAPAAPGSIINIRSRVRW